MIRVLDFHWHCVHNRRLLSIPWMQVSFFDPRRIRGWRVDQRPPPDIDSTFAGYVDHYEPGLYDLVILHLDNWCAGSGYELRAAPMRYLQSVITDDVPQVVICHGRPNNEDNRKRILSIVGDRWLVCNSFKAQEEWNHVKSVAIWHGYRVDEWPMATFARKPYALAVCSGGGLSYRYHGINIIKRLRRDRIPLVWLGGQGDTECASFDEYRAVVSGARCLVHTAQWAPMSGSRTEAMLCGVPVVSTGCDDEHLFLRDGENAFVTDNYAVMRDRVRELLDDVQLARRIGEAGRETARELFNAEAYAERWQAFVEERLGLEVGGWLSGGISMLYVGFVGYGFGGTMSKALFLPAWLDGIPRHAPSPRIRCEWPAKHWPDADVFDGTQSLEEYDALIFQKAYLTSEPRRMMKRYKDKAQIGDVCDPEWLTPAKLKRLYEYVDRMRACVVPTERLAEWYGKWLPVHVIPDCVDLACHAPKTGAEEPYFPDSTGLVWLGGFQNYAALQTLVPVITTLDLPLATIADRPLQGVPFIEWEGVEQANEWLKRFEIVLNPQPNWGPFGYKSDNKTITAWACGVPVAHDARELHELLRMSREERLALGLAQRKWVEKNRSADVAARMWQRVIEEYV